MVNHPFVLFFFLVLILPSIALQVSELLGSFGDNELSPECLDGAQKFLKEDGISIPSSYVYFCFISLEVLPTYELLTS